MAVTLPYEDMEFVPLDILTAQEQNQLVANIEYLAGVFPVNSSNLATNAVTTDKVASGAITSDKLSLTTLFSSQAGATSITLSSSVANFSYIWIFYKTNDGFVSSKIVEGGQDFVTDLTGWQTNNTSPGSTVLKVSIFSFSGTHASYLANTRHSEDQFTGSNTISIVSSDNILITKVIGIQ